MYGKACGLSELCDIVAGLYRIDRGKVHFSSPPDKFRYPQAQKAACLFLQAGGLYDLRRKCGPAVPLHRVYRIADPRFLLSLLLPWTRFAAAVFLLENSLLFAHGEDGGRNSLHDRISFREFQFLYALYHTFFHLSFNLWLKFFLRQAVFRLLSGRRRMLTPETQKDVIPFENNKKKSCDPLRRGGRESRRRDGRIGLRVDADR